MNPQGRYIDSFREQPSLEPLASGQLVAPEEDNWMFDMRDYWNSRAATYDGLFDRAPIRAQMMEEIACLAPCAVSTVLDLGAGTGKLVERLLRRLPASRFVLVDTSKEMLSCARSRLAAFDNVEFYIASFEALPLRTGTIDLVVSSFALHHVDDGRKSLAAREINRVLRPNGWAIIADEMFLDYSLANDPDTLHRRMLELFYPQENDQVRCALFAGLQEWPSDTATLTGIFESAGLSARIKSINEIVGILIARKDR